MNIALAIGLQVIGSVLFAGGAIIQAMAVRGEFASDSSSASNRLSFRKLLKQFKKPRWLLGLLCVFSGAGLHLYALSMAPVAVVQPVGILAVPWSILLAARVHGRRVGKAAWLAVGITVIGVVGFTVFSSFSASDDPQVYRFGPIMWSFLAVCLMSAALAFAATKAVSWARAMLWAAVGATMYGLASGMMKAAMNLVKYHSLSLWHWSVLLVIVLMVVCYVVGVWMIHQGYASGPEEITVGTMTTVDPFVAVIFGLVVLGEGRGMSIAAILAMGFFFCVAVYGVALLSHEHPDARKERDQRKAQA